MQISGRNATSALEDATTQLRAGMEAARRGGESLPQLRAIERQILRTWAFEKDRLFQDDPTLKLERRQAHGEHVVGFESLVVSQPDIAGAPASQEQMEKQMLLLGFRPLSGVRLGKPCSISFYHPERRIALFDAHPGNFFHTPGGTLPIDCILSNIQQPAEHAWLMDRVAPNY